jgi:hypothetical protein
MHPRDENCKDQAGYDGFSLKAIDADLDEVSPLSHFLWSQEIKEEPERPAIWNLLGHGAQTLASLLGVDSPQDDRSVSCFTVVLTRTQQEKWGFAWDKYRFYAQEQRVVDRLAPGSIAARWNDSARANGQADRCILHGDRLLCANGRTVARDVAKALEANEVVLEFERPASSAQQAVAISAEKKVLAATASPKATDAVQREGNMHRATAPVTVVPAGLPTDDHELVVAPAAPLAAPVASPVPRLSITSRQASMESGKSESRKDGAEEHDDATQAKDDWVDVSMDVLSALAATPVVAFSPLVVPTHVPEQAPQAVAEQEPRSPTSPRPCTPTGVAPEIQALSPTRVSSEADVDAQASKIGDEETNLPAVPVFELSLQLAKSVEVLSFRLNEDVEEIVDAFITRVNLQAMFKDPLIAHLNLMATTDRRVDQVDVVDLI